MKLVKPCRVVFMGGVIGVYPTTYMLNGKNKYRLTFKIIQSPYLHIKIIGNIQFLIFLLVLFNLFQGLDFMSFPPI